MVTVKKSVEGSWYKGSRNWSSKRVMVEESREWPLKKVMTEKLVRETIVMKMVKIDE